MHITPATILVIAGHDPSGGAGIQADIETIHALGSFPATVVSSLTVQDSRNVEGIYPVPGDLIRHQAFAILNDYEVKAIKIGLLGSVENAIAVADILAANKHIPVVLDTVLAAGGGAELSTTELLETIVTRLLPHTTLVTPNSVEARRLTNETSLDQCADMLLRAGAKAALITGEHEQTDQVTNTLYRPNRRPTCEHWTRLPDKYHGSGCTLASAIATLLGQGVALNEAVSQAQQYTWETLEQSLRPGKGQRIPNRCFKLRVT